MWLTLTEAGLQRPIAVNFAIVAFIRNEPDGSHIVFTSGSPVVVMESMTVILSRLQPNEVERSRQTSTAAPRTV